MSAPPTLDTKKILRVLQSILPDLGGTHPAEAVEGLALHLAMTMKWSRAISLTSIRSIDEAVRRHVRESLTAAERVDPAAGPLLDVGSGNGYPGLPIKIVHPTLKATFLEPHLRRSVFLERVIATLKLRDAVVRRERIDKPEDLLRHAPIGTITMRAVNAAETLLRGAEASLAPAGALMIFAGADVAAELRRGLPRMLELNEEVMLPDSQTTRLLVFRRV
ncbi:MAG: class I SAM-dependent methyltransferase [Acidobacteria bacterium]|nr:class I SAM-dependent methyltransferase [Acidobacteriota bacterium]